MSTYRLKRLGEQIVFEKLKGAKWAFNSHDIDWHNIKVTVKVRGRSGAIGDAFIFTSFGKEDVIYVLVGIDSDSKKYFWILNRNDLGKKQSYYASIKNSVKIKDVPQIIKFKASYGKDF